MQPVRRYFVTVLASDPLRLRALSETGLDFFQATARETERGDYAIDGLVTMSDVERLVEAGYRVLVEEEASKRARAQTETIGFQQWLSGMQE